MKIKSLFILLFLSVFTFAHAQLTDYSIFDKKFNFYVANDLGRNGYYDQKPIAELMGTMGEEIGPEFVLATGDVHHFDGVRSVNDPLWMTNYELIYSHPELAHAFQSGGSLEDLFIVNVHADNRRVYVGKNLL